MVGALRALSEVKFGGRPSRRFPLPPSFSVRLVPPAWSSTKNVGLCFMDVIIVILLSDFIGPKFYKPLVLCLSICLFSVYLVHIG